MRIPEVMYNPEVRRLRALEELTKHLKRGGWRVEGDGPVDLVALDPNGARVAFKFVDGLGKLGRKLAKVEQESYDDKYDKVYVVLDERGWVKLTPAHRARLRERGFGVLCVLERVGVEEILSPTVPRAKPQPREAAPTAPTVSTVSTAPAVPTAPTVPPICTPPPIAKAVEAQGAQVRASSEGVEVNLPDFVKGNPWLSVVGSEG